MSIDPHSMITRGELVAEQANRLAAGNGILGEEVTWFRQQTPALVDSSATYGDNFGGGYAADRVAKLAETLAELGHLLKACPTKSDGSHALDDIRNAIEARANACAAELSAWGARLVLDVKPREPTISPRVLRQIKRRYPGTPKRDGGA